MTTHTDFHDTTTGDEVVAAFSAQVTGRIFLITGPTTGGIGAATATALAKGKPQAIILAGQVVDEITRLDSNIKVITVVLDLGNLASVRTAAKEILDNSDIPHIDVLINNAGIMAKPFSLTPDGIESQFGVNHVGHFLLTNLLMPKLRASANPTVVNVSSTGYLFGLWDFSDYNWETRPYNIWRGYGQGKLANVLFAVALAERGIRSTSLNPGIIFGTQLGAHIPPEEWGVLQKMRAETPGIPTVVNHKTLAQGCSTTLVAALDPGVPVASYLDDCQVAKVDPRAVDPALAKQLWDLSNKLTGENFA
ncbi:NAD(P)-binding protein [Auriculariales sp. MPI-PUGE-AT-0066]|nr:NAD(P)-binding protein [Auriculariales sp. MPI-PUGE-AT-0066]